MAAPDTLLEAPAWPAWDRWLRHQAILRLDRLQGGELRLNDDLGSHRLGDGAGGLRADIRAHAPSFYRMLASGGSVGAGEAYALGLWDSADLTAVIRLFARNLELLDEMEGGLASLAAVPRRLWHRFNRNSVAGSRRNIAAHYDLGNELFEAFLDRRMQYSSAIFPHGDESLDEAQEAKLDRIASRLGLRPGMTVVEIGSGWGGLAVHLASRYGCHVDTTTISDQQFEAASRLVRDAGLADRVRVLRRDYRQMQGCYDRLVSVEMVEAVGHRYLDGYFGHCRRLLKDAGRMLLQAITIDDGRYERALRDVDFIQRYIFPGSFIPSVSVLTASAAGAGLRLTGLEDIGQHYARTLELWERRFDDSASRLEALGYDEPFRRLWKFYFCYCRGGFLERRISDVQMEFNA